ncbi:hypothetical protein GQ54DRAFT_303765 [Martensiomyces pterosporus]|nr:hypothetical protein GQ54DRAFT_303765 [Martensiomyces pterosporus]
MNLSGLSYLQFLVVDAFIAIYLFLRINETRAWASINPVSVLRLNSPNRADATVRMIGFYSCLLAVALFMARDGIMASMELQDVNLCRAAIYLGQTVTPLDAQQLPDIKKGLDLWDVGSAFILVAMGCVMRTWASVSLRRMLGKDTLLSVAAGQLMLAFGFVSFTITLIVHFAVFKNPSDISVARSISRITITMLLLVFWVLLIWVLLRVNRILHQTRSRDPNATAAVVAAVEKVYTRPGPMPNIRYLIGMQSLSFMKSTGVVLALILFVRIAMFLTFDIGYLTPSKLIQNSLSGGNTTTGIGTLSTSLLLVAIVHTLFPWPQDVLVEVFSKVAEMDEQSRMAFIDGKPARHSHHGNAMSSTFTSRNPSFSASTEMRSRTQSATTRVGDMTTANEAKAITAAAAAAAAAYPPSPLNLTANEQGSGYGQQNTNQKSQSLNQPDSGGYAGQGFLQQIPYIDRNTRENSFFSQGPWSPQGLQGLSSTTHSSIANGRESMASTNIYQNGQPPSLEQLVHSNTGAHIVSAEGRQDMLQQSAMNNASLLFADSEAGGSRYGNAGTNESASVASRLVANSAYIPMSSSQKLPSVAAQTGMPATRILVNEAAAGPVAPVAMSSLIVNMPNQANTAAASPSSLISAYAHMHSELPTPTQPFAEQRPSSFVSDEYQYEPSAPNANRGSVVSRNPFTEDGGSFEKLAQPYSSSNSNNNSSNVHVYVASPTQSKMSDTGADGAADEILKPQSGTGPILIRKGSKASVRRKGTVERKSSRKRNNKTASGEMRIATSSQEDTRSISSGTAGEKVADSAPAVSESASMPDHGHGDAAATKDPQILGSADTFADDGDVAASVKVNNTRMSAFNGAATRSPAILAGAALEPIPTAKPGRDSSTISGMSWDNKDDIRAAEPSLPAAPVTTPLALATNLGHLNQGAASASNLSPSLYIQSLSNIRRNSGTEVHSSLTSLHTATSASEGFFTPNSSIAQIGGANAPSIRRVLTNDSMLSLSSSNNGDIFLPASSQFSLAYADASDSGAALQSAGATRISLAPVAEERPSTAPSSSRKHDSESLSGSIANQAPTFTPLRRVETLRKAVATDALLIESSLQSPTGQEDTGEEHSTLLPGSFGGTEQPMNSAFCFISFCGVRMGDGLKVLDEVVNLFLEKGFIADPVLAGPEGKGTRSATPLLGGQRGPWRRSRSCRSRRELFISFVPLAANWCHAIPRCKAGTDQLCAGAAVATTANTAHKPTAPDGVNQEAPSSYRRICSGTVDAVDDKVAQGVAFEAREIAEGMASGNSTYIQTFVAEYVDDLASTLRTLRACQGGSAAAVQRLTTTLAWREANKVYPAKKQVSSGELFVDSDGMVVVKTRQAALMANPASKQRGPSCVVPPGSASGSWKSYARAIETLEDARVALKSAYMSFRIIAQAAVVVPLESVSLSEINTKSILDIIDVAEAHYSSLVGRVYITATSSVLLEHARQSLWPVFSQLDPKYTRNITFVKAGMLPATHTRLEDFVADIRSGSGIRQQQVGFEGAQQDPGRSSGNVTTLDEFVKQTSSLHSGHTDTDADDFQSLYSDARDTGVRLDGAAGSRQRWVPSAKTSNRSGDGSVCSLGGYLDQMQFGNRASQLSMTTLNKLPPTDLKGSCRYKAGGVGRATQGAGATRRDTLADSSRIGGGTKYNSNSSGGGSDDSESRRTLGSITPIQLASLQRAVQGVQQMLGIGHNEKQAGSANGSANVHSGSTELRGVDDRESSIWRVLRIPEGVLHSKQGPGTCATSRRWECVSELHPPASGCPNEHNVWEAREHTEDRSGASEQGHSHRPAAHEVSSNDAHAAASSYETHACVCDGFLDRRSFGLAG